MALSGKDRERAEELAKELWKITGGRFKSDGTSKTFLEIEDEAIDLTDFVASVVIKESAAELPDHEKPCRCPQCGAVPKTPDDDEEPIVLQTDRGEVGWGTRTYYCRRCRRSFPATG